MHIIMRNIGNIKIYELEQHVATLFHLAEGACHKVFKYNFISKNKKAFSMRNVFRKFEILVTKLFQYNIF